MKFLLLTTVLGAVLRSESEATMQAEQVSAVRQILEGKPISSAKSTIEKASRNFHDYSKLALPAEVAALLKGDDGGDVQLDEKSIGKARTILNGMMESAQNELDSKTMACKEFKEKNRQTWDQVSTDLKRLAQQISNLEGVKSEASGDISTSTEFVNKVEEDLSKEQIVYDDIRRADEDEMVWRKNDLKVAEFLLKLTKCKGKKLFLQGYASTEAYRSHLMLQKCSKHEKGHEHHHVAFASKKIRKVMNRSSAAGKRRIQRALLAASHHEFLQEHVHFHASPEDEEKKKEQKPELPTEGSSDPASSRKQAKKCSLGRPNCGLMHDNMSVMWGEMKDAVDDLDAKMRREEKAWKKKLDNWNDQISLATGNKETSQGHLSTAMAEQTADAAEQDKKEQEERRLEDEFRKGWAACVAEMNEILFTKFCGVKAARGELHKNGEVKPEDLLDCEVTDWVAQACTVPCDDELVGGVQDMVREVVQKPNENGVICPALAMEKKCNQIPCPIDCKLTHWSMLSSCTTECGGGVQTRTRTVVDQPRNGGQFCDVPSELSSCNTGSCDRDCDLTKWKVRPCSVSCGGGWMIRKKHVTREARANGRCPKPRSFNRYGKMKCNKHNCYGDEECLAKQDVLIAIDGSGSLKAKGFRILKMFAAALADKYRGEVEEMVADDETFEEELKTVTAVATGVIQFGNGVLDDEGVVGPAEIIKPLDPETKKTVEAIDALEWRRGFTNMAQAFTAAETAFLNGGRQHAQSILVVISDGKPSFNFQTANEVAKARRKGVKVVMVVVKEFLKDEQKELMRSWSSVPRNTNFIHIPGLKNLRKHEHKWVNRVLIRTCSKTISLKKEEELQERWEQAKAMDELAEFTED